LTAFRYACTDMIMTKWKENINKLNLGTDVQVSPRWRRRG